MKRFNLLFMLATCLVPLPSFASDQVQVELVPASSTVHAGSRVTVGLRQHIAAGWHTYWRNPGDSGLPTSVDWKLPSNVTAGGLQWPAPSRFTQGGLVNFGYEREVTLLTTLEVDSKATVGHPLPIEAHVKWLVCRDTCLPQEATLHATLTVSDTTAGGAQRDAIAGLENDLWPHRADWLVQAVRRPHQWTLRLPDGAGTPASAYFYPDEAGVIDPHGPQSVALEQGQHLLKLTPGDTPLRAGQTLSGTLVLQTPLNGQTVARAYAIDTPLLEAPLPLAAAPSPAVQDGELRSDLSLVPALALALLGGLILNLMPCVFPVLSIKALSMLSHSSQSGHQRRMHGLAYTAGVLMSFAALAAMLLLLRAGGKQAGWGFQFQSPAFVMFVAYLMFGVGLNLAGLFSVGNRLSGMGSSLADRGGYAGSFFTGVLATIVATPCTAPFMGGAIGYALTQPALPMVLIFEGLGLGLALPYLILSLWPALQRWLPRPGLWMERLKQFLAFPMFGAAVWLVWVLTQQAGSQGVVVALSGMVALAFAAWLYGSTRQASALAQHGGSAVALLILLSVGSASYLMAQGPHAASTTESEGPAWQPYSASRLKALRAEGRPVFIDLTAAWCLTCLVNERVALNQALVGQVFASHNVEALKGDWTNQDAEISALLRRFGRTGVPLYVFYPEGANSQPRILPQILTPDLVLSTVTRPAL